jgi:small-conductance mechanosensitive channel
MTIALRKQLQQQSLPQLSFGPFRFLEALPWLVLAAAMRVVAFGGGPIALPAIVIANIAVLHAFLMVAQCSIELAGGRTGLDELGSGEQFGLSLSVLWRITLLMIAAALATWAAGYAPLAPHLTTAWRSTSSPIPANSGVRPSRPWCC